MNIIWKEGDQVLGVDHEGVFFSHSYESFTYTYWFSQHDYYDIKCICRKTKEQATHAIYWFRRVNIPEGMIWEDKTGQPQDDRGHRWLNIAWHRLNDYVHLEAERQFLDK